MSLANLSRVFPRQTTPKIASDTAGKVYGRLYDRLPRKKLDRVMMALDDVTPGELKLLADALREIIDDAEDSPGLARPRHALDEALFPNANRLKSSGMGAALPLRRRPLPAMSATQKAEYETRFPNSGRLKK